MISFLRPFFLAIAVHVGLPEVSLWRVTVVVVFLNLAIAISTEEW